MAQIQQLPNLGASPTDERQVIPWANRLLQNLSLLLQRILEVLNGGIELENLSGVLITLEVEVPETNLQITHNLGRVPRLLLQSSNSGRLKEVNKGLWTKEFLEVAATESGNYTLFVM